MWYLWSAHWLRWNDTRNETGPSHLLQVWANRHSCLSRKTRTYAENRAFPTKTSTQHGNSSKLQRFRSEPGVSAWGCLTRVKHYKNTRNKALVSSRPTHFLMETCTAVDSCMNMGSACGTQQSMVRILVFEQHEFQRDTEQPTLTARILHSIPCMAPIRHPAYGLQPLSHKYILCAQHLAVLLLVPVALTFLWHL